MPGRRFKFDPDWKSLLFVVGFLPVLVSLGFWQLHRGQEKQSLAEVYASREVSSPVALGKVDVGSDTAFMPVWFSGQFQGDRYFLLDNQVRERKVGYEVIMPVLQEDGAMVLLNLGWIEGSQDRNRLPEIAVPVGTHRLSGTIYVPVGEAYLLQEQQWSEQWPVVIQAVDIARMKEVLGVDEVFPYVVRSREFSPGALLTGWPPINMAPEKHYGYSAQWFLMAFALVMLFFSQNSNLFQLLSNKEESNE